MKVPGKKTRRVFTEMHSAQRNEDNIDFFREN